MTATHPATSTLLTAARQWWDAGYAVIPSHEDGSKRPFGQWKQYQATRPTWEEITGWLQSGKYTGIGVITGAASGGAQMVEIEGPIGKAVDRLNLIIEAAKTYGSTELVALTARGCVEQSAGGGLHMFMRHEGDVLGNTKLAMQGQGNKRHVVSETRGEGGFVIVAPTPARNGHEPDATYLFLQNSTPAGTPTITTDQRDELHLLITLALNEDDNNEREALHRQAATHTPQHPQTTPTTPTTDTTFGNYRAQTTWADILTPAGWTYSHHATDGRDHWTRPGKNVTEGTSATTLEDGPMYVFSSSTAFPQETGISKEYAYTILNHNGDLTAASRELREQGYAPPTDTNELAAWDWTPPENAHEYTPEQLDEARNQHVREKFPRLDWTELWANEQKEEWIVEPLIAARRLVALYSAPKVGKSLLMLELAAGIAAGAQMWGNTACTPRRTLYVDFENDPLADTRERLQDMGYQPHQLDNLVMLSFPTMETLDTERGSAELMQAVTAYNCEIVVIDTVSRAIKGLENENDTWLGFYRHTGLKLKQAGIAMIRLDHSGKDEAKGQRGASAKSGDVDAVWRLKRAGEDTYELECEAQRFPIEQKKITLTRETSPLRHKVSNNAYKDLREELLTQLAKCKITKDPNTSVRDARKLAKNAKISFTSQTLNADLWARYCAQPDTWEPAELGAEIA